MMTLKDYLDEYTLSHQHPVNVLIHKVCVPVIMFSLLGILKALPVPYSWPLWFDWSLILIFIAFIFYLSLRNWRVILFIGMEIVMMLFILEALRPRFFLLSLALFILAWIGQFIGHKIEGKKPSFFKDLIFLLIGPIWTLKHTGDQWGSDFFGLKRN